MHKKLFAAAAVTAMLGHSPAQAKVYHIQLTSVCDHFTLKVADHLVVGTSDGTQSNGSLCDNSFLTGTQAHLVSNVSPGGSVLVAAGDLGLAPNQYVFYFNLSASEATLYGTTDGKTTTVYGPFSFTTTNANTAVANNRPTLTSIIHANR